MNVVVVFKLAKLCVESIVVDIHQELLSVLQSDDDFFLLRSVKSDGHVFNVASRQIVAEESVHRNPVKIFHF